MRIVERRQLKVYLEADDFRRVTQRANEDRQSVSEYVRELVLQDLAGADELENGSSKALRRTDEVRVGKGCSVSVAGLEAGVEPRTVAVEEPRAKKEMTCPHGYSPGWRCTLCGGKVTREMCT
jgi:hypothetical protein